MGFFAGMTVCFSATYAVDGWACRLIAWGLCLLLFRGIQKSSRLLIPLFLTSAFLRLLSLWEALERESGGRGAVLWALCLVAAAVLSFLGRERLSRAFLPCGLVLLPLLGFVMAGEWHQPAREPLFSLSLLCSVSGAFLLPPVQNRLWTAAGVLVGGVFGVLMAWVSFPVWESAAVILCTIPCAAMELGMVWKPSAYKWNRRDANAAAKRNPAGDGFRR